MSETNNGLSRRMLLASAGVGAATAFAGGLCTPAQAKAPMQGAARPAFHRVKLGGFEVTTIFDGFVALDGPHPIFGMDQKPEDVQALAQANFLPPSRMTIGFTPTLVNTGNELVLFDSGNGAGRRPNAGLLRERMAAAGLTPEQVDVVVLTHFHPDHIGGLMEDGNPAFPNARYVAGGTEYDFWSKPEMADGPMARVGKLVQSNVVPFAEKMSFVKDGDSVVSGITAVGAAGHTPGHTAYHLESDGKRLLLWGDACNHYVISLQKPEWHVRFDMDKEAAGATRKKLIGMVAADKIPASGYHMPFPTLGYVEAKGDGFRWEPASYQFDL